MTFLNPLYLIALAAAAIPIILHLLNLRKTRVIEFSTLSFLKELQRSRIRKLKIKQWLLLILRTLLIIFIVLAFTRPALRSSFGFLPGSDAKSSVVIILDDSFSMMASDEGGSLLRQAKEKALAILDLLKPGDEVALVRFSEARKERQFTSALNAVRDEINTVEHRYTHLPVYEALTAASVLLQQSHNINREVYLISDEQQSNYSTEPNDIAQLFDPSDRLYVVPVGKRKPDNAAVTDVIVQSVLFEKEKPVELSASLLNDGSSPMQSTMVSVFLDGERVAQRSVDLEAGTTKTVEFTVVPKNTGFVEGFIELENDALPEDNKRAFAFYVPDKLRILLAPSGSQESSIMRLALQPLAEDQATETFQIDAPDRNAMLSANLQRSDVIVLIGTASASDAFLQRVASFVGEGGSLLLFPDADGNIQAFSSFMDKLSFPIPQGTNGTIGSAASYGTFGAIDFDHPLFRTVFRESDTEKKPQVESPKLYHHVRLKGNEAVREVITTSSGDAFLLDGKFGKGRVLVIGVSPSLRWSDFPLKGIFVPLMHRAMFYLAARDEFIQATTVGKPFDLAVPPLAQEGFFDLVAPGGITSRLTAKTLGAGQYFTIDQLDEPGIYTLKSGEAAVRKIAVHTEPAESRMARIDAAARESFFQSIGVEKPTVITNADSVQQAVMESRYGVELWKYMLLLALVCGVAEMLIARDVKRTQMELAG